MQLSIDNINNVPARAREFVRHIGHSRVFAFYGDMGVGKTTFIRALCEALGVSESVTSPTFAIVNEYRIDHPSPSSPHEHITLPGVTTIYHFDFYRIRRLEEAYDMGFEDYLYSGQLCFIEWPELVESLLPNDTVRVHIEATDDGARLLNW